MQTNILIVEDEYIVSLDLKNTLEDLGHRVTGTIARGEDVVAKALEFPPDLVLMDIQLSDKMRGTEAAEQLKKQMDVPVIFLTAYCDENVLEQAEKSFPHGYLIKPFDRRELEASIRMAVIRHQAELKVRNSEQRLQQTLNAAKMSHWQLNLTTDQLTTDDSFYDNLQRPDNTEGGLSQLKAILAGDEHQRLSQLFARKRDFNTVFTAARKKPLQYLELFGHFQTSQNQHLISGILRDVTSKQKEELQLRQANTVFKTTSEAILVLDDAGEVISVNPAFSLVTGYSEAEVRGMKPDNFLYQQQSFPVSARLQELSSSHWSGEVECKRKDGSFFPAWQHLCKVRAPMTQGAISHYVVMFSDISALRRAEEHLATLAFSDHLTGLGNRVKLEKMLRTELIRANRNQSMLGILYLDLDGFKLVNDTLGHHAGDLLLQEVAKRISQLTRAGDVATRVGGDEFVLVVPDIHHPTDCLRIAEKILLIIGQDISLQDNIVNVSASIGIACYPDDATSYEELLKCADLAMFAAKDDGRNRFSFFNPLMAEKTRQRVQIEKDLKTALCKTGELIMYYQPIVRISDQELRGFEALIRWDHPTMGFIPPDRFIKIAEQSNLINEVGDWVLQQVFKDIAELIRRYGKDITLSINLSVRQLEDQQLADKIRLLAARFNVTLSLIYFEITETALSQSHSLLNTLDQLRRLGARISVDDFGTGYSSLSRLRELPIDCLKIDKAFVISLGKDRSSAEIVRAICALGKALELVIIAEGVETQAQYQTLKDIGCDKAQGYLFGRPGPLG
ncbi:EAL domain-containing protein [Rheinheimera sp. 1928-s]|uniref:two-component system response regulator n=1 Tax=Rheinheimera sp. 1928-s TaxID=3033803 RepID=UPI00261AAD5D|nr:EAL domain-containing protein [Rheinheimera sp. 1928-s]MDF3126114.1 EAL domain-containing protein [Rheinheimera sp. 1928-s]